MESVKVSLETQPLFTLFLTVALGYLVGEINIKGFLSAPEPFCSSDWPSAASPPSRHRRRCSARSDYCSSCTGSASSTAHSSSRGSPSADGLKANAAAAMGVIGAGFVSLALVPVFGVTLDESLGMFAGSGTSTATLQAIIAALKSDGAAVGYSVAYPFGVAGPILCIFALNVLLKPKIEQPANQVIEVAEIALLNSEFIGMRLSKLSAKLPAGVAIAAIRRAHHNQVPSETLVLQADDVLLGDGDRSGCTQEGGGIVRRVASGRMTSHREDLDYLRVFASSRAVVGLPSGTCASRRASSSRSPTSGVGDADLLPHPELVLEVGDRVGLLANRADTKALRKFFGDSIKGTAELSFISIGMGAALGLLLGLIPLTIPGIGKLTLGLAALLLLALYLGKVRRTGPFVWTMPLSANLVLRNFGLTIFLAQVGIASGPKFFATVGSAGISFLLYGVVIVLALVLITAACCLWIFRLPFDTTVGIISGATGNPAILGFASRVAPTDKPDIGYAMIFPSMTVGKILFVQIAAALLSG